MMIAASGTIRIPTRRRPLHALSQFDKNSGLNPGCKHDKMISPPTHRRARAGKGCRRSLSPAGHPARHRKRTVPSLRSVAASNRMNSYRLPGGQHQPQLTQPSRPGYGGRWPARVTISPQDDTERARPFAPGHHSVHSTGPFTGKFMALCQHFRIPSRAAWVLALLRPTAGRPADRARS